MFAQSQREKKGNLKDELIQALLDSPYEGLIVVDRNGIIRHFSKSSEQVFGIRQEDAMGKYVTDVVKCSKLHIVAKTGKAEFGDVVKVGDFERVVARFPLMKDGKVIGAAGKSILYSPQKLEKLYLEIKALERKVESYKKNLNNLLAAKYSFKDIIGNSQPIKEAKKLALKAAQTLSPVLIVGETGTGKELFAHAIHNASIRRNFPFVKINCAAIPRELFESELFGYESGAFTGAKTGGKLGKFELANGGTIFLDEISELPLTTQAKLLRVLQEKELDKLGGREPVQVDFRLIVATNKELEETIEKGEFKKDLFYRLNVINLKLPPLRNIKDDIPSIVHFLMTNFCKQLRKKIKVFSDEAIKIFMEYNWPGNFRELENMIETLVNICDEDVILPEHIPAEMVKEAILKKEGKIKIPGVLERVMKEAEREAVVKALSYGKNNKVKAAQLLGIHRSHLYYIMKKHGLNFINM
jgi:PAS domain S-box-containing protein